MNEIALRPVTPADSEFCYQLHKAAMGGYVAAIWGWDEQVQRGFHDRAFDPGRWQIITADGADAGMLDVEYRSGEIYLARIEVLPRYLIGVQGQAALSAITSGVFAGVRVGWSHPGPIPAAARGVLAAFKERRRWTMNSDDRTLLSVRAEARDLVAPDYAVVDGLIEHTAGAKADAVRLVAGSLDHLLAELAALGAVPFDAGTSRRPLTWSAHSWSTREELYHDQQTMQMERSGQLTATVALRVTVRDMDALENLSGVLAAAPGLNVHGVTWQVDWDNPAWPQVRAAAIAAAVSKARDYAAALGATVGYVEHIADPCQAHKATTRRSRAGDGARTRLCGRASRRGGRARPE